MAIDRDRWRKSAEEAWDQVKNLSIQVAEMRADKKYADADKKMRASLAKRFPDMAAKLMQDSRPTGFDELPPQSDVDGSG